MAEFAQRFCLDLANAFACYVEVLAYLFERSLVTAVIQTKPQANYSLFTRAQGLQNVARDLSRWFQ